MTDRGATLDRAIESLDRTKEALARNVGTITEQDWQDAVDRATAKVETLREEQS